MEKRIKQFHSSVQENILKAFEGAPSLQKAVAEEFEKAKHQVGDIHPNGKWVYTEYKPGKFDWRAKGTKAAKEALEESGKVPEKSGKSSGKESKSDPSSIFNDTIKNMLKELASKKTVTTDDIDDFIESYWKAKADKRKAEAAAKAAAAEKAKRDLKKRAEAGKNKFRHSASFGWAQ